MLVTVGGYWYVAVKGVGVNSEVWYILLSR